MRAGDLCIRPDRLLDQFDAALRPPGLQRDDAQHVQRIEMAGLGIENFQVDAFGRRQIALPVPHQSLPEPGLQCRHFLHLRRRSWRGYFVSSAKAPFQSSGGGFFR